MRMSGTKMNYDFKTKNIARAEELNFILRNYRRENIKEKKVLFLPGYDTGSNTSLELAQVYDKLKVPRSNIVGIEVDSKIYRKLKGAGLGIRLENCNINDFVKTTKEKFDVISLDYTCEFNEGVVDTIRNIFNRNLLNSPGILYLNVYTSREKDRVKQKYKEDLVSAKNKFLHDTEIEYSVIAENSHSLNPENKDVIDFAIDEARRVGNKIGDLLMEKIDGMGLDESRGLVPMAVARMASREKMPKELLHLSKDRQEKNLDKFIETMYRFRDDMGIPAHVLDYLQLKFRDPYILEDVSLNRYVSDRGSPMMGSLFMFNKHPELFDENNIPISLFGQTDEGKFFPESSAVVRICNKVYFHVSKLSGFKDRTQHTLDEFENPRVRGVLAMSKNVLENVDRQIYKIKSVEPKFLGSCNPGYVEGGIKPATRRMTRWLAYKLFEEGLNTEDVIKNYSNELKINTRKLASWKARHTISTRNNEILSRIAPEDLPQSLNRDAYGWQKHPEKVGANQKLSRKCPNDLKPEIYKLIQDGVTVKEISERYKIKPRVIGSLKAWHTMKSKDHTNKIEIGQEI